MPFIIALLAFLFIAAPAHAQTSYVGASIIGELLRTSAVDVDDDFAGLIPESLSGEAIGFGVVAGTAVGERWGLEVEFVQPGEIEKTTTRDLRRLIPLPALFPEIPIINVQVETETRHTTLAALAWVRQTIGDKLQLAYLGGISFARSEFESSTRMQVDPRILQLLLPIRQPEEVETITLHTGPVVGAEARWRLGDRASVVGGARLHSLGGLFLIRPAIGVHWSF